MNYRWQRGRAGASYTRSEGGGGGTTAATTIVDTVSLNVMHRPAKDWTIRTIVNWNQRESISSSAFFGLDTRVAGVSASLGVQRKITPRFSINGRFVFSWNDFDEFRPGLFIPGTPPTFIPQINNSAVTQAIVGTISVRYTFDPYVF